MSIFETTPKYKQLKELLLEGIYSGKYPPESRFPSENECVKEFGVSKHTVLKAIGELVNENLLYRKQGSGTYVRERQPQTQNINGLASIAVLDYGSSSQHSASALLRGFDRSLRKKGHFNMNLTYTDCIPENEIKAINRLAPFISGFAVLTVFREGQTHPAIELLKEKRIPFVSLLSWPDKHYEENIDFAVPDDFKGGFIAVEALIKSACTEIFILMPENERYSLVSYEKRLEGGIAAINAAGLKFNDKSIIKVEVRNEEHAFMAAGYRAAKNIARHRKTGNKTGVFALMSDFVAVGVAKGLREEGISIPEDVLICGYDNISELSGLTSDFISIETSLEEIGYRGAELLQKRIASGSSEKARREIIPVKLMHTGITFINHENDSGIEVKNPETVACNKENN